MSYFFKVNNMAPEPNLDDWESISVSFSSFLSFSLLLIFQFILFPICFPFPLIYFYSSSPFFSFLLIFPLFFSLLSILTLLNPFLIFSSPVRIRLWLNLSITTQKVNTLQNIHLHKVNLPNV